MLGRLLVVLVVTATALSVWADVASVNILVAFPSVGVNTSKNLNISVIERRDLLLAN